MTVKIEDDINLLDYWFLLVKWRKSIFVIVTLATLVSILIASLLPKVYRAEATIMPIGRQGGGGLAALASQMGGAGALLGGVAAGANPATRLLAILKSRSLAERVINNHDLTKILYPTLWDNKNQKWKSDDPKKQPLMEDIVKTLFSMITFIDQETTQLILVNSTSEDPQLAAELANMYLNEFLDYLTENAFTMAKRNRIFIEEQLKRSKEELLEAGKELASFYGANKISNIVPTVSVDVSTDHLDKEVQNSLNVTIDDLTKQAHNVQEKIHRANIVHNVPQHVYLQYLTLRRELLVHVYSLLTQQYEMAKIDETKEDLNFQVLDWARVPAHRFKPKRTQIVFMTFFTSLFFTFCYACFMEYLEKLKTRSG